MNDNLPAVRVETNHDLVNPTTDSWTVALAPVVELARSICGTDFVPDGMRDNVAATTAAIMYGRELGLPPMTALGSTHMIKGRVGVSAEILRALVLEQGHEIVVRESSGGQVVMAGRRKGSTDWTVVTWTLDDARRAKLSGDNWTKYPRQMLAARASAELCRLIFADVIHGMAATEELEGIDAPALAGPVAPGGNGTKVQRKSRTSKTDDGAVLPADAPAAGGPSAAPSSPPMPPLPGEPGFDGPSDEVAKEEAPAPEPPAAEDEASEVDALKLTERHCPEYEVHAPHAWDDNGQWWCVGVTTAPPSGEVEREDTPRPISRPQQRAMFAVFKELGIADDQERMHITSVIVGRMPMHEGQPSSNGLTAGEAKTLLDALARCKTRDHVEALVQMAEQQRAEQGGSDA